jgi:outer membrane protein insertion porin family
MFKYFIKFIFLYLLLVCTAYSEIIETIEINGNKRISSESIIIFSKLKKGSNYSDSLANNYLKNLYDTDFFEEVDIDFINSKIIINVKENPIIDKFDIIGIKKKNFLEFIKDRINLKERSSFTNFNLKNDLATIENILKSNGYYFSNINVYSDKDDDLNTINLKIEIDLGTKSRIKNLSFIGDKVFKEKKLTEVIVSEEHKFWKFISKNVYLNQNLIDLDIRLLENFYKNRGYYNVNIVNNFIELQSKDGSFNLIYNIDAGKKFTINKLSLSLPDDYKSDDFDRILKTFKKNENETYSLDFINQIISDIENIASSQSYDFIDVSVEEKIIDDNKIDFNFLISDSNKFYIERINFIGNYTTIEEVLRNKIVVDEGDPLNNLLFEKSINNIKALGFFKKVQSRTKNGLNENLKVIDIIVEEQPTGEISIAAGYGTNGFQTGGQLFEKNFLGKGIELSTDLQLSNQSIKGQINYSKPNFAYTDNTLSTSLKATSNDFLSLYGYETKVKGVSIGTEFEQYEKLFFSPELSFTNEDLTTNINASNILKKQQGNYSDLYFNYGLNYNLTNSNFNPKSGYRINFNQELPLYSDTNELTNTLVYTRYNELNKNTEMIAKTSIFLQSKNTIDGSDVRISKRATIPYNRLRGFEKGKVGPVDNKDYIGGNYVSTLNISTNLPQLFPTIENIDFNYFIDVANVWGVDYNDNLDNSKIRTSTGLGLNLITPIGPLSFSIAQPITKASSDKTETFRFNLGTTF